MTKIMPVDSSQNIYASDIGFKLVSRQDVLFEGRSVTKLVYRDAHSLIWKIAQIALAVLITLTTLSLAFCFRNGMIWKEALAPLKERIVHQNIPVPPPQIAVKPMPQIVIPASINAPVSSMVSVTPINPAYLALQLKKERILKENPEYGNAVMAWEKATVSLADQVARLKDLQQYAFGSDKWSKYFGSIAAPVPPLPDDIHQICNANDHFKPNEKVKDTHVLVLVPEAVMVNGKRFEITLKSLSELVEAPKNGGHKTDYCHFESLEDNEDTPVAKSHWALMKKEILPGSKKQEYARHVQMVDEFCKQAKVQYRVPNAIDAVMCCFMNFVSTGNRIFEFGNGHDLTYTRCQEEEDFGNRNGKFHINVGGFEPDGLFVSGDCSDPDEIGVSAVRVF